MTRKYVAVAVMVETDVDVPIEDIFSEIDDSDLIDEVVNRKLLLKDLEKIYLLKRAGQDYGEVLDQLLYKYIGRT